MLHASPVTAAALRALRRLADLSYLVLHFFANATGTLGSLVTSVWVSLSRVLRHAGTVGLHLGAVVLSVYHIGQYLRALLRSLIGTILVNKIFTFTTSCISCEFSVSQG